ncbi:hypothetical protein SAMN05444141_103349 [Pseudovibrio denitrificans]|uniref:Uncharacterized protein n=1 Tax=Pseudovibrio denitrificans TaxID=258256 RepID=A0A1I7ATJ2_9HYPH|nr:hypothetical protein SAMN05444141_103349 [Pseudovibrio denitrificans]
MGCCHSLTSSRTSGAVIRDPEQHETALMAGPMNWLRRDTDAKAAEFEGVAYGSRLGGRDDTGG